MTPRNKDPVVGAADWITLILAVDQTVVAAPIEDGERPPVAGKIVAGPLLGDDEMHAVRVDPIVRESPFGFVPVPAIAHGDIEINVLSHFYNQVLGQPQRPTDQHPNHRFPFRRYSSSAGGLRRYR